MTLGFDALRELVLARGAARAWLDPLIAHGGLFTSPDFDEESFLLTYSSAARRLGKTSLELTAVEAARLASSGVHWQVDGWGMDELGRVALLTGAFEHLPGARAVALLEACYARGDNRERQAVLRALPFLPERSRFVPLAIDACRTSVQTVFDAIACENPFPADEFPDPNMNQMVLKALFNGMALKRIVGLDRRRSAELARMAADYAAERRAAGRSVPSDIDLVFRPLAGQGGPT